MSRIDQLDPNFAIAERLGKEDAVFRFWNEEPFRTYGVFFEGGMFRRIPEALAKSLNPRIETLHTHTAGGRIRFRTNSPYVAIAVKEINITKMPHFALTASAGFDLYVGPLGEETYFKTFVPPYGITDGFESVVSFASEKMRDITLNLPLYTGITELKIGLAEKAELLPPAEEYAYGAPVVYYGSSITQGGCASRPGNAYQSIISRRLKVDHINLGFSGNAKGEASMAEYMASLPASVYVMDYDHNAPTVEHLEATHEPFFRILREKNPDTPILLVTRPAVKDNETVARRREIILKTYQNALAAGDPNVYFLDGRELMKLAGTEGTVDGTHPNDFGFFSMAKAIGDALERIL